MAAFKSVSKHNICAHLDLETSNARHYTEILTFLRRSRIFTAISTIHVHISHIYIDCKVEPPVIRGKVLGHDVVISAEHIRRVCGFQDSHDQPTLLDRYLVRGCFMRCKYEGDLGAGILNKAFMSPQFKYLAHVLVHCLGSRRGGFNGMRETIQCAFFALVLNRPFTFSEMVFLHNVTTKGDKKFMLYPRFLQQIIDVQLPGLPMINADILRLEHMNDTTLNRVLSYRGKDRKPAVRDLFGHLSRPDYVAPGGRRWIHHNSDSEVEDIIVPSGDDDDNNDDAGVGAGGAGVSSVVDVSAVDVSTVAVEDAITTGPEASGHGDEMDLDVLLDRDFLTTTTASVSTPLEMAGNTSGEDLEGLAESDDSDDAEGAGGSDSEDTPDDEFESVWVGKRVVKRKRKISEAEQEEITDPSFIPSDSYPPPHTSTPVTTVTPPD
ncbi:hypothetical protein R6Q57_018647 [Mikania cordata]